MGLFGFGKKAEVLVADDDLMTREMLSEALTEAGMTTDVASDGMEAVQKAKGEGYKVIILDWNMPDKNGLEALREIRRLENHRSTAVFMLTGESKLGNVQQAYDLKVVDYLIKPVNVAKVLEKVQQAIARS